MADKIQLAYDTPAVNLYALIRTAAGTIVKQTDLSIAAYATANLGDYDFPLTEQGTASRYYTADFPAVAAGLYAVTLYLRAGGAPAETDTLISGGTIDWDGANIVPLATIQSRLPTALTADGLIKADTLRVGGTLQTAADIGGIVSSGAHGNAALKALIDTLDTVADAILADTGTDGVVLKAAGLFTDAVEEIRNAITGGAYPLSTDANGRMRSVDGTGAGEIDLTSGLVTLADGSLVTAKLGTFALAKTTNITGFNDLSAAQVNAEADTALSDIHLDHLFGTADPGGVVANDSFWAKLLSKSAIAAYADYVNTTDSLQAIRDSLSTHSAADVWAAATRTLTSAANITSTGGTTVPQTGDSFARIGATGSGLTSLAQASVCTELRLAELDNANLPTDVAGVSINVSSILGRLPAALVGGRIDSSVGAMAAAVLTAASTAADYVAELQAAMTGGAYALSTDANGRVRIVDGTGVGELNTNGGNIEQVNGFSAAALASINSEVVDVIRVDLLSLPGQVTPSATPTLAEAIMQCFQRDTNPMDQSATLQQIYNRAGAVVHQKRSVSEAGGVVSLGALVAGP